jgi:cell division protease FtsH
VSLAGKTGVEGARQDLILRLAAQEALAAGFAEIMPAHLLMALGRIAEASPPEGPFAGLRKEFEELGIEPRAFRRRLCELVAPQGGRPRDGVLHRSARCREIFRAAGNRDAEHLLRAALASLASEPPPAEVQPRPAGAPAVSSLGELTRRTRALRRELLEKIFGQAHAIHQFVEGLFNVEVVSAGDPQRKRPAGLFLFAGPPGVGKTYLAELGAERLGRPFLRLDMSAYGVATELDTLIGSPPVYSHAKPGILTGFVSKNPTAVLLFDEIEKACSPVIHLFLQILDAGRLQDKNTEEVVAFRDTIVIFTTNVGKSLYDNRGATGVQQANAAFSRASILDALRSEIDPRKQTPYFPEAICSRMATGYTVLFNHLRVGDLARIAEAELRRVSDLLAAGHGKPCRFDPEIPLALVMREGAATDARTVRARAEAFLKEEIYAVCRLFSDERVDESLAEITEIAVELDREHSGEEAERLFGQQEAPSVLFVGSAAAGALCAAAGGPVRWLAASNEDQTSDLLAKESPDLLLLELAMGTSEAGQQTVLAFDYAPPAARRFAEGQKILERLRTRLPDLPVFLFDARGGEQVDPELLAACMRAGGARGVVEGTPLPRPGGDAVLQAELFAGEVAALARELRFERRAAELGRQNYVLAFDTAPVREGGLLRIRCRNLRLTRAVRSGDAGALVSDVERPAVTFDDVIGGGAAKEALALIRDWLRDPKKYAAAGVEAPRGVLLTGPPGTGKTLLARALAGESNCAFLVEAASALTGKHVGSGPENVRKLFERARRYAPSIVFIDELDAVGGSRGEVKPGHVGHAEAMTLNQLLTEMDGFSKNPALAVIVLAATNHEERLDPALKRRFSRVIEVELPTSAERALYLRRRLQAKAAHAVSEPVIERIALQSAGRSIADLERVMAEAAVMALAHEGIIDDAILSEAFEKVLLGTARENPDPLRTARHEAGHALAMHDQGAPPVYVTIVGRGNAGGYAAYGDAGERGSLTKPELEARIRSLLAGREAERLYYGPEDGLSTGASNDLERSTSIAETMVYELGMSPEAGPVRIDRRRPLPAETAERCHAAVRQIIERESARVRQLLERRRDELDRVVEALVEKNRLLRSELLELLEGSA